MFPRLLLVSILLLLGACQSPRIERDFDTSRDFAAYRSWSWQEPALQYRPDDPRLRSDLTEQRIRSAIEQQLEQRGLRPAQPGNPGDLRVQARLIVDQRQEQVSSHYGGYWGGYWDGGWGSRCRRCGGRAVTFDGDWRTADQPVQRPRRPDQHRRRQRADTF